MEPPRRGGRHPGAVGSGCGRGQLGVSAWTVITAASPAIRVIFIVWSLIAAYDGRNPGQVPLAATWAPSIRTCGASSVRPAPVGSYGVIRSTLAAAAGTATVSDAG